MSPEISSKDTGCPGFQLPLMNVVTQHRVHTDETHDVQVCTANTQPTDVHIHFFIIFNVLSAE